MITGLPDGTPCTLIRPVLFHLPGRGYVELPVGAQVHAVNVDRLPAWQRDAIQASANRDENMRGVDMVLVHCLGAPRLMDFDCLQVD